MITIDWKPDGRGGWSVDDQTRHNVEGMITQLAIEATTAGEALSALETELAKLRTRITVDTRNVEVALREIADRCKIDAPNEHKLLLKAADTLRGLHLDHAITTPIYVGEPEQ